MSFPRSHPRKPGDQLEYCDICGRRVVAQERTLGDAQGLYGRYVCPEHAKWATTPAFQDYGGLSQATPPGDELEPHSGADWIAEEVG